MSSALPLVNEPGDAELISAVRGGDLSAYGLLYERHVDAARRLARQIASGPDADDLVADAFAKVLSVLQRGGGPDVAFRAYLLTSVRSLRVDRYRATSKVQPTDDLEAFDPGVPFRDTAVEGFENAAAARAFASLPERWQLVLWHTEVEGQKPADVAPLLGMTPNSVSALAYRAREGLRQAFLTQHTGDIESDECRWTHQNLGAYIRKGTSKRDSAKVEAHLDECSRCMGIYLELTEVNSNLAGILAPLLLGGLGTAYVASGGAVTASSGVLISFVGRVRDTVLANASTAAVAGAAGVVVASAAAAAVVVQMTGSTPADPAVTRAPQAAVGAPTPGVSTPEGVGPRGQSRTGAPGDADSGGDAPGGDAPGGVPPEGPAPAPAPGTDPGDDTSDDPGDDAETPGAPTTAPEPTPEETPSRSPRPSSPPSPRPTLAPTPTATAEPTATPEPTPTATATATAEPTPTATATPEPTPTGTPDPDPSPTATPEPTPTATADPSPTATPDPTPTATPGPEPTPTPDPTADPDPEPTTDPDPEPIPTPDPEPTPDPTPDPDPEPTPDPDPEVPATDLVVEATATRPSTWWPSWDVTARVTGLPEGDRARLVVTTTGIRAFDVDLPGCSTSGARLTCDLMGTGGPLTLEFEVFALLGNNRLSFVLTSDDVDDLDTSNNSVDLGLN